MSGKTNYNSFHPFHSSHLNLILLQTTNNTHDKKKLHLTRELANDEKKKGVIDERR